MYYLAFIEKNCNLNIEDGVNNLGKLNFFYDIQEKTKFIFQFEDLIIIKRFYINLNISIENIDIIIKPLIKI